ncbi:MAG: DUF1559 domain-containing protein [Phycisphaerales bacterium]|nr:DUF1559 domain-containing protein [Phycisphaerales bacterium]
MRQTQTAKQHDATIANTRRRSSPRGFSLIDVLVSMVVVVVLISLLLPSLSGIRETSRRVVCASNIRQIGLGMLMYAEDNRDSVPYSKHVAFRDTDPKWRPDQMMVARDKYTPDWDGTGLLFSRNYLPTPNVFYCPSHLGSHRFENYSDAWTSPDGEVVGNYHYRGMTPAGTTLMRLWPGQTAILADGLATQQDYNHASGNNALRGDMSVNWVSDFDGQISQVLAKNEDDALAPMRVRTAWLEIDRAGRRSAPTEPGLTPAE